MIVIYGELYSSKNSKRLFMNRKTGKTFIAKSKKSLEAEKGLASQLSVNKRRWLDMLDQYLRLPNGEVSGKGYPLYVRFKIYRKTRRRFDFTNIVQQLCDQMVVAGYLPDDDANHLIPVFVPHVVDPKNPRVEIDIVGTVKAI